MEVWFECFAVSHHQFHSLAQLNILQPDVGVCVTDVFPPHHPHNLLVVLGCSQHCPLVSHSQENLHCCKKLVQVNGIDKVKLLSVGDICDKNGLHYAFYSPPVDESSNILSRKLFHKIS